MKPCQEQAQFLQAVNQRFLRKGAEIFRKIEMGRNANTDISDGRLQVHGVDASYNIIKRYVKSCHQKRTRNSKISRGAMEPLLKPARMRKTKDKGSGKIRGHHEFIHIVRHEKDRYLLSTSSTSFSGRKINTRSNKRDL